MTQIVVLAAGKGTRMRSNLPKVLHAIAGKPMLLHVIDTCKRLTASSTTIVVGHGADEVIKAVESDTDPSDHQTYHFARQEEQLGTGHAVQQALPFINDNEPVLILYGDVPLISSETLSKLVTLCTVSSLGLLTVHLEEPDGYGRIVRDTHGDVQAIVEQKDADASQQSIGEVNTGVMCIHGASLHRWLPKLSSDNAQNEYYLTDLIAMGKSEGTQIHTCHAKNEAEVMGVNNRLQQSYLERQFQRGYANNLMANGLTLLDPDRFDCRGHLQHGNDCVIDINCVFQGENTLGNNITIGANCYIKDAIIGDNCTILPNTVIENAVLAEACHVGPFARLRPGTVLKNRAKIGNFVETKKTMVGEGSKINHLSYIGDARLGNDVNIGAGTITCNYDGVNKHQTAIEDGAFVGSNSALVAPISIGKNATIGAGTVMTKDASENQLVVARPKQQNVDGWVRPTKA